MRGRLGVRVNDGRTDRVITNQVRELQFKKTAPGGHHSMTCKLNVPRSLFPNLGPADRIYVYDSRTGATVWEGYTDNPGPVDGAGGEAFEVSASGGMTLANDMSSPFVFMERSLDDALWQRVDDVTPGATIDTSNEVSPTLRLQFPAGIPVGPTSRVVSMYMGLQRSGQRLYAVEGNYTSGKNDSAYVTEIVTVQSPTMVGEVPFSSVFVFTNTIMSAVVGTNFPLGRDACQLRIQCVGAATTVNDDGTWSRIVGPYVKPLLVSSSGTDVTSGVLTQAVRAHEVVNHLLGSSLPLFNGAQASVSPTSYWITQLTYHDGAKPIQVLDDLAQYEPNFLWEVLESNTSGKHRFNYREWPTEPRYEISVKDGYSGTGGESDLCNRVVVYWTDTTGQKQATIVTQTVPELVVNGVTRVRDADPVTLPAGQGSLENAQTVGASVLADKVSSSSAGTAVVARPIMDFVSGCMVMPWEIEAGYVVHVRETGQSMRLTELSYSDDGVSAQLTLGNPVRTPDQILVALARQR